ncbi:acetyl-CoA synthetase [Rhizobium giardinii]|uniref:Acetyl-CoA synthetase n=1 Tax=Rhizobium giardinii TaxID=56731 RepID=A0A7W8UG36_9HYPH|nr:acetyl-CoA synthetase [Rhizobium giardinii]
MRCWPAPRIGAIPSVVFGFSPDALAGRIIDCESTFVITCDEGVRGGKSVPLKENTDKAIDIAAKHHVMVNKVLVVRRTGGKVGWAPGRDLWSANGPNSRGTPCHLGSNRRRMKFAGRSL